MPFISYLIAVARTCRTMLNKSCESGHPCFVPNNKQKAWSFCPFNIMLTVGLSYMAFIMLRYVPFVPILLRLFIKNGCWVISNAFSVTCDPVGFILYLLYVVYHINFFKFYIFIFNLHPSTCLLILEKGEDREKDGKKQWLVAFPM